MREVGKVLWISERDGNGIIIADKGRNIILTQVFVETLRILRETIQ